MKFLMDYDNIPGKGPLMLFKDNGDGTLSLATVEDIATAISNAVEDEREACAKVAEDFAPYERNEGYYEEDVFTVADKIRARSSTGGRAER